MQSVVLYLISLLVFTSPLAWSQQTVQAALTYLHRQNSINGRVSNYKFFVNVDPSTAPLDSFVIERDPGTLRTTIYQLYLPAMHK